MCETKPKMKRYGFTLIELLVVVSIIALLLAILMPALNVAREQAKISVCLSSEKQLIMAWLMYADDNDGKIVESDIWTPSVMVPGETVVKPKEQQLAEIEEGYLYKYISKTKEIFQCPSQRPDVYQSYNISHAMGSRLTGFEDWPHVFKLGTIKFPSERLVFVDEYQTSWGPWTQYYDDQRWWNQPPVRHIKGGTFNFADGHADYWKWQDESTIEFGKIDFDTAYTEIHAGGDYAVEGEANDLHRVQRSMWGRLGYDPADYK